MEWDKCCNFYIYPAGINAATFIEHFECKSEFGIGDWQGPGWYICSIRIPDCTNHKKLEGVTTLEEAKAVAAMMHHMA